MLVLLHLHCSNISLSSVILLQPLPLALDAHEVTQRIHHINYATTYGYRQRCVMRTYRASPPQYTTVI